MRRRQQSHGGTRPAASVGEGSAWLIFDAGGELFRYQCYWMAGHCDDHLIEHARVPTDADAVAWARDRTPRARIRMADHRTYWAGSAPRPAAFSSAWRPTRAEPIHQPAARQLAGRAAVAAA